MPSTLNTEQIYPSPNNVNPAPVTPPLPEQKKGSRKSIIIMILLVLILLGGAAAYYLNHKDNNQLSKLKKESPALAKVAENATSGKPATYETVKLSSVGYTYSFTFSKDAAPITIAGINYLTGTDLNNRQIILVTAKPSTTGKPSISCPSTSAEAARVNIQNTMLSVCNILRSGYAYATYFSSNNTTHFILINTPDSRTAIDSETLKTIIESVKVSGT